MIDIPAATKRLEYLEENADPEWAHSEADSILCAVLDGLGYVELVDAYHRIKKWYA